MVKTWRQLRTLPPIELGVGVKVRLGLQAAKAPRWSGVLLYCLTEGYRPPAGVDGAPPTYGSVQMAVRASLYHSG